MTKYYNTEAIRKARLERGWNITQLAASVGVTEVTMRRIEKGIPRPSDKTCFQISKVLEIPIGKVVTNGDRKQRRK